MFRAHLAILSSLLVAVGPVSTAVAAEVRHVTRYNVSLGILPVASADFSSAFNGDQYSITGTIRSSGVAQLLSPITAKTSVTGRVEQDRLQADTYNLVYTSGKRTRVYDVTYRNGNVTDTTITPPPRRNRNNWVPVTPKDLRSVLDPLSGLIFPEGAKLCQGRVPVYDGESRMDLVLKQQGTKPFETEGFKGDVIVCSVRYMPRSGFRRGRSDIEYLKKTPMEVWFAKAEAANVYAPIYARIPTRMGQLHVTAARYGG
jgi:hypothetical protein